MSDMISRFITKDINEFDIRNGTDEKALGDVRKKQNSSYLSEVSEFLRLNAKCKAGTFDESNKCGPEKENAAINNVFQEVSSSFNAELGGFHTTDYKADTNKPLRVISQDKADNPKVLEAIKDIEQDQLPSQFLVMKMKNGIPAKYYSKTDSIGVDKNLSSKDMSIEIRKVLDGMKANSAYLQEAATYLILSEAAQKLNANCKAEEKVGEGPGSCSSGKIDIAENTINTKYKLPIDDLDNLINQQRKEFGHSFLDSSRGPSNLVHDESKPILEKLAKENNIDPSVIAKYDELKTAYSWGDGQERARSEFKEALINNTDLGKFILAKSDLEEHAYQKYIENLPKIAEKNYQEDIKDLDREISSQDFQDGKTITKYNPILDKKVTERVPLDFRNMQFDSVQEAKDYLTALKNDKSKPPALYRKGKYHSNFIESYTTHPEGTGQFKNPNVSLSEEQRLKDGWRIFTGIIGTIGEPDEKEITLININDIKSFKAKSIKENSIYLSEVSNFIKLNYNCPDSEKVGSGKGSCSGGQQDNINNYKSQYNKNKAIYDKIYSDHLALLRDRNENKDHTKDNDKQKALLDHFDILEHASMELSKSIGNDAPDSDYTRKLDEVNIISANKLRESSKNVFLNATESEIKSIEGNIIASDFESGIVVDYNIPTDIKDIGNIVSDPNHPSLGSNPEVQKYVQKVYGVSDTEFRKLVKKSSGGLRDEYITQSMIDTYYGRYASALGYIKNLDNILDKSIIPEKLDVYSGMSISQIPDGMKVGDEFIYKAFLSTSRIPEVAKGFSRMKKGMVAKITLLPGSRALALEDFINNHPKMFQDVIKQENGSSWIIGESGKKNSGGNQREVLLSRNQKFRVTKISGKNINLETIQ